MIPVHPSLLQSCYNDFSDGAQGRKAAFHSLAVVFFAELARHLRLPSYSWNVKVCPGSKATSGTVSLHHPKIFLRLDEPLGRKGLCLMYAKARNGVMDNRFPHKVVPITIFGRRNLSRKLVLELCEIAGTLNFGDVNARLEQTA